MLKLINAIGRMDKKVLYLAVKYLLCLNLSALHTLLSVFLVRFSPPPRYRPQLFPNELLPGQLLDFPSFATPTVSIIIPVFNQWSHTFCCLQSIRANTESLAYEIIVADDGSTDETANIEAHVTGITVIRNGQNLQFLRNCNNAARHARGKYLVFLNNDTNVQKDWLYHLLEVAEGDAAVGIVGSKLVYPDGRLQEAGGIVWRDGSAWNYGWFDDPEKPQYNEIREVDYVSGACLLLSKELWTAVGGFDERFVPAYYEDTDLAFEARKLGYKVMYQPKSVVLHFEGISCGTSLAEGLKQYQKVNRRRFLDKWKTVLARDHFDCGANLAEATNRKKKRFQE